MRVTSTAESSSAPTDSDSDSGFMGLVTHIFLNRWDW